MSKYIIDIPKTVGMGKVGNVHYTYFDGIQCQTIVLKSDEIEELNSDYINEHFSDLQDTAYQKGLEEGREQMPCDTCAYRHNNLLCTDCKWNYGSRYKVDSIGVGDVVIYNQKKCVVVTPETNEKYASLFDCNGNHYSVSSQNCQKTGEHYNINEILGGLRDD